jgi:class 3 adenylate cyclase
MPDLPRGTVTFLFTDIEGSTSLVQRLGDGYGRLLGDHRHLLRVAVEDAGGVEVDCRADEFFGGFSGAQDAVRAAVSAQRALKLHRWPDGLQPAVRMGIHTGEPALADEGYLGLDVHRAARICSAANGGQVLISETTHNVLADTDIAGVSFSDLGEHDLKGLPRPERIFQLVVDDLLSEFPPLRGADTGAVEPGAFGGRERELAEAAVGRLRQALSSLGGAGSTPPDLEGLGWKVRVLLPAAPPDYQRALAELGSALLQAGAQWPRLIATWRPSIAIRWSDSSSSTARWESSRGARPGRWRHSRAGSHTSTVSQRGGKASRKLRVNSPQAFARSASASGIGRRALLPT